ncbi:MAG: FAD-binding oxidoreductase [Saccharolobus sp.]
MRIVIVGGGIVGSSIYRILKKEGLEVTLFDAGTKRQFPTLIHSLLLKDQDIELSKKSLEFYNKFRIPYIKMRSYTIGNIDSRLLDLWTSAGVNINEKFVSWLGTNAIEAIGGDGLVSISALQNSIEKITARVNVIVDKGYALIKIGDKTYKPDLVIISAGAWSKYIVNIKLPIKSYYCWAFLGLARHREIGSNIIYDYINYFYSRPVIGLGLPFAIMGNGKAIDASPYEKISCIEDKDEVINRISKRLGIVKDLYTSGNFCEATPDMRPAYGKISENVYYIGGFNGYGAEVGPGLATILSEEIITGKEQTDFKKYRIERFKNFDDNFEIGKEAHEL